MTRRTKNILLFIVCLLAGKLLFSFCTPYIVSSGSMEPDYPINSIVFTARCPLSKIKTGDVIVFRSVALNGQLAFHRVIRVTSEGVYTKGDNNTFEDSQLVTQDAYIGKEVFSIRFLSRWLTKVGQPLGVLFYLILPLTAIVIIVFSTKYLLAGKFYEK